MRSLANNIKRQPDILNLDINNEHTYFNLCIIHINYTHTYFNMYTYTGEGICHFLVLHRHWIFCKLKIHGNCGLSDHG